MVNPINPQRLDEIQDCERETRDGPWILADANDGDGTPPFWVVSTPEDTDDDWSVEVYVGDKAVGEFIAMARTAVPELLAEVGRLTADRDQALQHVDELQDKLLSTPDNGKCCCSFEGPGDVCMTHSPTVNRLTAEVDRLTQELAHAHGQIRDMTYELREIR